MQTDATRTCELVVGLRDVTVLGVDERLRQPLEVWVDPQHPGSIALSRSQKVQVPLFDAVIKVGHAPEVPVGATFTRVVALSGSRRPCPTFCPTFDPTIPSFCVASRWAASQPSSYSLPMTWENRTRCDTVGTVATFGNALFIPWPTNGMLRALGMDAASGEVPGRNVLGHGFGWRQSIGAVLHPNNHPNNLVPDCPSPSRCRQAGALGVPGYHGK